MADTLIAVDLGMTNIDTIIEDDGQMQHHMLKNPGGDVIKQLHHALDFAFDEIGSKWKIGVTGGRYRDLPDELDGLKVLKVDEMQALGLGGLALAGVSEGLVVSAGTGTAMVAARGEDIWHVTGSAVGGGTLIGLACLILETTDVQQINRLALQGDASAVDVMLTEAVGGKIGKLPDTANAVNFGKIEPGMIFSQEDLAAGLVRLVSQVIAVIAINAAAAENLTEIILVGHLVDLEAIRREIRLVGNFYNRSFTIPENPGCGTAAGVLAVLKHQQ